MRFGVVIFPGTWSDMDFHHVISQVLHQPVEYLWHRDTDVDRFDCLVLPGGFSYGDYLRARRGGPVADLEALPSF
jgi:phosphoribosylformylglycinamidine synthase